LVDDFFKINQWIWKWSITCKEKNEKSFNNG
jgi:hypothetical protein